MEEMKKVAEGVSRGRKGWPKDVRLQNGREKRRRGERWRRRRRYRGRRRGSAEQPRTSASAETVRRRWLGWRRKDLEG